MVALTPDFVGNLGMFTAVYGLFAFAITIYGVYLNWKQSKVLDTQRQQTQILIEIRDLLRLK